ncbi:MAG: hypothetical protein ABEJ59_02990 [Halanaeroarchaeum sp.]
MQRVAVAVLVLAVALQPIGVGLASGASADPTIVRTMSFSLTPQEPGSVDVRVSFEVPDAVESLTTTIPSQGTVVSTNGFSRNDDGTYTWEGGVSSPSLTLTLAANQTGAGLRAAEPSSGYEFVDVGPWAIVSAPAMSTSWSYRGPAPSFVRHVRTATDGIAGERMVYLGPSTEYHRTAGGQRFTLVVPDAASLGPDPREILDAVGSASQSLRVGERDPDVTIIAAPAAVDWAAEGLAADADAWVKADRTLDDANDVWLHEYVHTRMNFTTTTNTRWLVEASAEYYAALLTLEQGRIDFRTFHDHLAQGSRAPYDDSVLTLPSTWTAGANYLKGGLVLGTFDRRIRLAAESRHSAADLFATINGRADRVSYAEVRFIVGDLSNDATVSTLDRYATTKAAPEMWSRDQHAAAFSTLPPQMVVGSNTTYRIDGPYRTVETRTLPTLVTGESLTVEAPVTNDGDVAGEYSLTLRVDGHPVDTATGTLGGRQSTTISLQATPNETGTHDLSLGEFRTAVTVASPATLTVSALQANRTTVAVGEPVSLSITATNPTDRPATGPLPIRVDGETVGTWSPTILPDESATTTYVVSLDAPGEHTVAVGNASERVTVDGQGRTETTVPGFSAVLALLALGVGLLRYTWRGAAR